MEFKVFESMIHPIRMRIIQELIKRETAIVKDISDALGDIPPASLYRHINRLVTDGILEIAQENKVRGTLEKVYRIKTNPIDEINRTVESHTPEQLMNLFYNFTLTLLSDFQGYLSDEHFDLLKDGVGFRSNLLYASDEEFLQMAQDLGKVYEKYLSNQPGTGRVLRKISTVVMPIKELK